MDEWIKYPILAAIGVVAGTLNVLAGGGSFLTMPALIFAGVPPIAANATNRVAIFLQNIVAVWSFHRHGVVDWRYVPWAAIPATCGAAIGAWAAVEIDPKVFRHVLGGLMIVVTLWTLWDPLKKRPQASGEALPDPKILPLAAGFFVVGIYGGFIQAGVGFLILAATTMAGLDLVRGNAVKVLSILVYTGLALGYFIWHGQVNWTLGLVLAVGNMIGSVIGVKLTILKGHRLVKAVVTVSVIALAIALIVGVGT